MPEIELLDKTEVWLTGITLDGARLPDIARAAARSLALPAERVFVTDVRDDHLVFDVLVPRVDLAQVAGKEEELLEAVRDVPGVVLAGDARVHSFGVLGVIGTPRGDVGRVLEAAAEVEAGVRRYVAGRAVVLSTGAEVLDNRVDDTNFEAAQEILGAAGYEVTYGEAVPDDDLTIAGRVARLVSDGYGLVVTSGGVGAEDKDRTIEALQLLDPDVVTADLATYQPGHGRHVKAAVRVGATQLGWATVVALPGPTHEVRLALPVVVEAMAAERPIAELVEAVAAVLRKPLRPRQP